ncbi:MAG TPA: hypothetical protein VGO52_10140 [Hyphomonadaceae bacterium]|nr:hypothetical protein [Hyphomonadaceae bacterium]
MTLTKAYDEAVGLGLAPVAYTGIAAADFSEVQGEWRLISRDRLQGGFVMRRISMHRAFSLRGREQPTRRKGLSDKELRARQTAIEQRRRMQVVVVKPRRRRPKPP